MLNIKRPLSVVLAGALLFSVTACGGGQQADSASTGGTKTIKIANYFAESHSQNVALREKFKPLVEENTDLKVEIYPNNELGAEAQYTNGLRSGTVEMAVAGMGLQANAPKLGVVEWPFLFEDYDHAQKTLDGDLGDELGQEFKGQGVKLLGWTANGFRNVSSNRPVKSMEDFKGLRLRMPDLPLYIKTGESLGVSVQPMAISEIFTALEQGVIDGQENPYATVRASGWHEVQSHILESQHMFSPNAYLMNTAFWEGLTKEEQAAIQKAADEASDYQWDLSRKSVEEDKKFLQEHGVEITVPDEGFKKEMVEAVQPVYDELYAKHDWAKGFADRVKAAKE
ncbi:TRAP transporter substrate-binding protein [Pseudarthrobacter phenanthrenivorans]|uniref:TRAP transporter substrate-binding protein n=1 Tax=Pseudarthrobacter phenanthrenivorans TaxID=361575 RepID=A0A3B0F457_PSEPS|nr:TRAP transporter substrate-binding protein [Pseudarthrobacter phenanthrenivorans]RKO19974.1 TRAP transporter substrate-binding protein [Pseudarthrobacter phenanthrenivorans]